MAAAAPADIRPLALWRMLFGAIMAMSVARFAANGWIDSFYVQPRMHFPYQGFAWVVTLPPPWIHLLFAVMGLSALLVAAGLYYRPAIIVFFLSFTWVELVDKSFYLNHYYYISLMSFLLIWLPAHGLWSLDSRRRPAVRRTHVPAWMIFDLRLQVGLVYFFAGVAKLSPDWLLAAQPLQIWLGARTGVPLIGPWLATPWAAYLMSWAGAAFDLSIPFLLSHRRTRLPAYGAVVLFHAATALLFPIGMFPWIMTLSALVFFDWPTAPQSSTQPVNQFPAHRFIRPLLLVFFLWQIFMPLRHWLYPGNFLWTEEGFRFGWHVMLVEKTGMALFTVRDPATGQEQIVLPSHYLTAQQEKQMSFQPDMILTFAHWLAEHLARPGQKLEVRAEVYVSLNGRPSKLLIDPAVNLAAIGDTLGPRWWVSRQ
jgi:hypothetical protein